MNIEIKDLQPGMILASPVYNIQGLLLLKAGAELTELNIKMLRSWGVDSVAIYDQGKGKEDIQDTESDADKNMISNIKTELMGKFEGTLTHPVMQKIMDAAIDIIQKRSTTKR